METALTQAGQTAHLSHYVIGPGLFSFWWKAGGPPAASMSVAMRASSVVDITTLPFGPAGIAPVPGGTGWRQGFIEVPAGTAELRFSYAAADAIGKGGLDRFLFQPSAQHPARGLDRWTSEWESLGDAPWSAGYDNSNGGLDVTTHGDIGDSQRTSLGTTVTGPKTLRFSWKVSSERNYDFFRLLLDGTEIAQITGDVPWTPMQFDIPAGQHTLRWVYEKDDSISEGGDYAALDGVTLLRSDFRIVSAKPITSSLALLNIAKDPWPGYIIESSPDTVNWSQAGPVLNTALSSVSVVVPATGTANFFRLRFAPEQVQPLVNAGFEEPTVAPLSFADDAPGWGPDGDGFTTTSFENIPSFAWTGAQHLSMSLGAHSITKTPVTLYPGRHSLTVAIGNRAGFTAAGNRTGYALATAGGTDLVAEAVHAPSVTSANAFTLGYPLSYTFTVQEHDHLDVNIKLSGQGEGRSHFDDVKLVSEPQ